ncbi:MAG: hypothetical protein ACRCZC_04240, partial [Culicoidibacterales bacterium]
MLFSQLWYYTKQHKKRVFIGIFSLVFSMLSLILTPLVIREILDNQVGGITQPWYEQTTPI